MLLEILVKHQVVDGLLFPHFPSIRAWNKVRNDLVFSKDLEISMLNEEYKEFLDADNLVDKFDALLDFGYVLTGTYAKWLEKPDDSDEMMVFMDKYSGHFMDLFIVFNKYVNASTGITDFESIQKLVADGMSIVVAANERKGMEKNEDGKVQKPKDFVGPEAELEKLLSDFIQG